MLHAPGRFVNIGDIYPVLEEHERSQGHVHQEEVMKKLQQLPAYEAWSSTSQADLSLLADIVKLAAEDDSAEPGIYIAEIEWCTLESGMPGRLRANIRCVNNQVETVDR